MKLLRKRLERLKKKKRSEDELKKAWKERLLRESGILEKDHYDLALKKITELESAIVKKGLETPTLKRLFNHTKKRFGLLSVSKEDLAKLIRDILNDMDDIASINEISLELAKRGYELSRFRLEKILLELSAKGIIFINRGVISSKRPSDTRLAIKLLEFMKDKGRAKINDAVMFLRRDQSVVNLIVSDLNKFGLIVIDKNNEIIYV